MQKLTPTELQILLKSSFVKNGPIEEVPKDILKSIGIELLTNTTLVDKGYVDKNVVETERGIKTFHVISTKGEQALKNAGVLLEVDEYYFLGELYDTEFKYNKYSTRANAYKKKLCDLGLIVDNKQSLTLTEKGKMVVEALQVFDDYKKCILR